MSIKGLQTIRVLGQSRLFFPELRLFAGEIQKQRALEAASGDLRHTWRSLAPIALVCALWGGLTGPARPSITSGVGYCTFAALALLAVEYGTSIVWRREIRQSLREQLRLLGIPVCEKCGYDLRGSIEAARCPECGAPFVPPNLPAGTRADAPDEQRGEALRPQE